MKELEITAPTFELIDIKKTPINATDLDLAYQHEGSYESLFNKRAQKWKTHENKEQLTDLDYKELILGEYTYLKRPLVFFNHQVFAGNSKKTIQALKELLDA